MAYIFFRPAFSVSRLSICTISASLITGEALPALERQNTFTQMMEIALRTAVKLNG